MTRISTEIGPETETGTGLLTEGGIDPVTKGGTGPLTGGKTGIKIEGEAAPMTPGREGIGPGTEVEREGEAGLEIIIGGTMIKTRHPDIEEDPLVARAVLRMYLTSCVN